MNPALICHGPGLFEEIDLDKATPEQLELAIVSAIELELVIALLNMETRQHELERAQR